MKDIFTVMSFTISDMVKRKSFIISTLVILLIIVIGFNIPNIIKAISGDDISSDKLLIADNDNIFEGSLELLKQMDIGYEIEIQNATFDEIKTKIENGEIQEAIIIEKQDDKARIRYILESTTMINEVPDALMNTFNSLYTSLQIGKLGLTEEELLSITPDFEYTLEQTDDEEVRGNVTAMMLMSGVLFYAVYYCAFQVSSSITTEKTSKIMETLVTSTSPRTIVLGKTIGIGIVGLLQMIAIVGTALISAKTALDPELLNSALDMSTVTPYLGIITIIYFILGYLSYSLIYALTGSTVAKPEDIQSANTPVSIIALIGFYLAYFTMMNPTSEMNLIAAYLPISSPFCMPFRIMMGLSTGKEVALSILILLLTILIVAKIAIKIYSNAILNYGTKMSLKDIINMYKEK